MAWLQVKFNHNSIADMTRRIQRCRASKFKKQVYIATLEAVAYHIWQAQNEVLWDKKVVSMLVIVNRIQRSIVDRVYSILPKKINRGDREWMRSITQRVISR